MAWIESHQSLARHRKTLRAATMLHVDRHKLIGHLHELWWWALDNTPSGDLSGVTIEEIAAGADWPIRHAAKFVDALTEAGFIDDDYGLRLHNWENYAGKLVARRTANKERMQRARAEVVRSTERARVELPNPTEQNRTENPRKPRVPRATKLVDEAFIEQMVTEWGPNLGGDAGVRERIAAAMNHTASRKSIDKQLYVQNWLRRDAQGQSEVRNGTDGKPGGHHPAGDSGPREGGGWRTEASVG